MINESTPFLAIQYHLYEHPLYLGCSNEDEELNVLLMGFDEYGKIFLDACLQNGQIRNKKLNVTVISGNETAKDEYLADRPELVNFFDVDFTLSDDTEVYGHITFLNEKFDIKSIKDNAEVIQKILCEQYEKKRPHYMFISFGNDKMNHFVMEECQSAIDVLEMKCIVSFICEDEVIPEEQSSFIYPLYINNPNQSSTYQEIERMAFNTHLVWEKNLNVDYRTVRTGFRKDYNHNSCIGNVISLKYKLYSIGIDLDIIGSSEAARKFSEIMSDKNNKELKNELIWVEHRRWVTEKLCLGWQRIDNLEECATGITKDEKNKRHICIRRSKPDQKLITIFKSNDNYEKWDNPIKNELEQLDELDRMSVELHLMYKDKAEKAKGQNLLSGNIMNGIRELIEGNRKSVVAFQEWYTCLKDIRNGEMQKVCLYKGFKNSFIKSIDGLPHESQKSVKEQVKAFESVFYPIIACMEYRDWKQDDVAFIDNIPFILTYDENTYLVIPYATGNNTEIFNNVAAPTVVNPARIIYLYTIEDKNDVVGLRKTIPSIVEYMRKKHFRAAVEFIWISHNGDGSLINEQIKKEIIKLGNGRIRQIKHIRFEELKEYLLKRSKGKSIFAIENNKTPISFMLRGAGIYDLFANYKFDSHNIKFEEINDCWMLRYIHKKPYITATDLAGFKLSSSESSNQPEFFDEYKDLWELYKKNSGVWKSLCNNLNDYSEKNDVLVTFNKTKSKKQKADNFFYIVPFVCKNSVEKILSYLKLHKILEPESYVIGYTSDSCKIMISDCCDYRDKYDKLFSNIYALMLPDYISLHLNTKSHEIIVVFDNLIVDGANINGSNVEKVKVIFNYFNKKGYIFNLNFGIGGTVKFTYSTRAVKELLTTAGKMLEIYTYHKIKEIGKFDDVVSSFEIDWENTEVKNEFDCILTKGFKTLFVECKARSDIEQEFYYKIDNLAKQFGINATAVLIADTKEKDSCDNAHVNKVQRMRGSMMDVVTIWKPDEINNIGHTLLKVINGNYKNEVE